MPDTADKEERTESATPQRREDARKKGQVAKSMELTSSFMFLVGLVTIRFVFPSIFSELMNIMKSMFSTLGERHWAIDAGHSMSDTSVHYPVSTVRQMLLGMTMNIGRAFAPFLGVMFVSALLINVAQVGFLISGEALTPKFDRISIIKGVTRLISKRSIVMLVQSLLKVFAIGCILYITVKGEQDKLMSLADMPIKSAIAQIAGLMIKMGIRAGALLFTLALFDYAYQRWEHEQSLKMTKQEIKQEMKQHEGDPLIKARIRGIQREMAARRMMQEVPQADVVITNPTHIAVALKYDLETDAAPRICAKGTRLIAEQIKAIAREHNVPIVEDKPLARVLYALELGQEIPAMLYKAVAEILARILREEN
ncbi:flagellar biosynthesis protein FlhB [Candidatus Poribacteria bacterium]